MMKRRSQYTTAEADAIRGILRKLRRANRAAQKALRRRLRRDYQFFISDFDNSRTGFTEIDFDSLVRNGLVRIVNQPMTRNSPVDSGHPKPVSSTGSTSDTSTGVHVLPDLIRPGLDLLICGMAAGNRSGSVGYYYADGRNRFWRTLHEIGLTPGRLAPKEFSKLSEYGIGLTDLAKYTSGTDATLGPVDFNVPGFWKKVLVTRPRVLAFNGKRAAETALNLSAVHYGHQAEPFGQTAVFVLPSTSGSASRWWNIEYWHECARMVRP